MTDSTELRPRTPQELHADEVVEQFQGLIHRVAGKKGWRLRLAGDVEDLIQDCALHPFLLERNNQFNPNYSSGTTTGYNWRRTCLGRFAEHAARVERRGGLTRVGDSVSGKPRTEHPIRMASLCDLVSRADDGEYASFEPLDATPPVDGEAIERVRAAVGRLPEVHRAFATAYFGLDGRDAVEPLAMARRLGVSVKIVRAWRRKCLFLLRSALSAYAPDGYVCRTK